MKANIFKIKKDTIARASQLIIKTNQFNLPYQKIDEMKLGKIVQNIKKIHSILRTTGTKEIHFLQVLERKILDIFAL